MVSYTGNILPGHLRKHSPFPDQLFVPSALYVTVLQACHDLPAFGGNLGFKATFDRVSERYFWPTMHKDLQSHCTKCEARQRHKIPYRRAPVLTGHV